MSDQRDILVRLQQWAPWPGATASGILNLIRDAIAAIEERARPLRISWTRSAGRWRMRPLRRSPSGGRRTSQFATRRFRPVHRGSGLTLPSRFYGSVAG
jgi:hypothetical protein